MPTLDALGRTALVPYWARVEDAKRDKPILGDHAAASIAPLVRERLGVMEISETTMVGCCLRNRLTDEWIAGVVGRADSVVIDIGVGLDTRMLRRPLTVAQYVEVDHRAVIDLRDELLPGTGAVRVAGDGMRVDEWSEVVDRKTPQAVVVLEGVLTYQEPARVFRFLTDVAAILPGAFVIFDSLSPWGLIHKPAFWSGCR